MKAAAMITAALALRLSALSAASALIFRRLILTRLMADNALDAESLLTRQPCLEKQIAPQGSDEFA
jgi:hypothetical protein